MSPPVPTSPQSMPKRRRDGGVHDNNPLSSARKGGVDGRSNSSGVSSNNISKADREARALWLRKIDAGFRLFLSYYGSQPLGVITSDDDLEDSIKKCDDSSTASPNGVDVRIASSHRGMSRAAKKRRQKKSLGGPSPSSHDNTLEDKHMGVTDIGDSSSNVKSQTQQSMDAMHPLIQAFATNGQYPHLRRFVHALSRPLPLTLRLRDCRSQSPCIENEDRNHRQSLECDLQRRLHVDFQNLIMPVSFDPTMSIYQSTPNSSLCKSNLGKVSPELKAMIVEGSMNGCLARQELGSMLPVICLRAVGAMTKGSKVLDLCASPGSKTLQALEVTCFGCDNGVKIGRVIANDVHSGRLDSLRDAVLRSGMSDSLTSRVTYTNYDASVFPSPKSGKLFDAVICDVPCGGDGTIRKDIHILPMWTPNISNSMHDLQLRILRRALELVTVGGVVCYSTCSMNPIEDEAVVAAALTRNYGADGATYELLAWPKGLLPGFIRRPGVNEWRVAFYDQDGANSEHEESDDDFGSLSFFDNYDSALAKGVSGDMSPTLWSNAVVNKNLCLNRCMRLLPQDNNSGGFFLGLIKRLK